MKKSEGAGAVLGFLLGLLFLGFNLPVNARRQSKNSIVNKYFEVKDDAIILRDSAEARRLERAINGDIFSILKKRLPSAKKRYKEMSAYRQSRYMKELLRTYGKEITQLRKTLKNYDWKMYIRKVPTWGTNRHTRAVFNKKQNRFELPISLVDKPGFGVTFMGDKEAKKRAQCNLHSFYGSFISMQGSKLVRIKKREHFGPLKSYLSLKVPKHLMDIVDRTSDFIKVYSDAKNEGKWVVTVRYRKREAFKKQYSGDLKESCIFVKIKRIQLEYRGKTFTLPK